MDVEKNENNVVSINQKEQKEAEAIDAAFLEGYPFTNEDGKQFTVRRLNSRDIFALARIISVGARLLGPEILKQKVSAENLTMLMAAAIPLAEEESIKLFASLIGVAVEEFDKLPPDTMLYIIEVLKDHIDVKRFFTHVVKLLPQNLTA